MKVTGIICEYNPFHNGHLHQIKTIKDNGSDYIIAVMSGDWVQRGAPSIIDKYSRTLMALRSGVDLVIELPVIYSAGAAADFAFGGTSLLDSLGCVDELCYGCETADNDSLDRITDFMIKNSSIINDSISKLMKEGLTYPKAREIVLCEYFDEDTVKNLCKPNNILATEYRVALSKLNSKIKPFPILRLGSNYNDNSLNLDSFSSATAIRDTIIASYDFTINDDSYIHDEASVSTYSSCTGSTVRQAMSEPLSPVRNHVPSGTYEILLEKLGKSYPLVTQNFSRELAYKLILEREKGFEEYLDVTTEISDKIKKNLNYFESFDQFCNLLKSKDLTYSRISRCLTHILLDIKKNTVTDNKKAPYARILGFRKDSEALLGMIKQTSSIPMISKLADADKLLDESSLAILSKDIMAAHMYDLVSACKYQNKEHLNEYSRQIIIV